MKILRWIVVLLVLSISYTPLLADAKKPENKTFPVPYRLTNAQHVMVRAKINGKGPYNFIIDTGAPALFVATAVCEKLGVTPDKKGWGTFDRFEIEGGVVFPKALGRVETPFQLEGMNGMGLAGVELHGIIGYSLLARYRITFDFTKDRMLWTELQFDPPAPEGLNGKGGPAELNAMAGVMKLLGGLMGKRPQPEIVTRGFLGVELAQTDDGITVKRVSGPAVTAGVKPGDRITEYDGKSVKNLEDVQKLAAKLLVGATVNLTILRSGEKQKIAIKAADGL